MMWLWDGKVLCFFLHGFGVLELEVGCWAVDVVCTCPCFAHNGFLLSGMASETLSAFLRCSEFWHLGMERPLTFKSGGVDFACLKPLAAVITLSLNRGLPHRSRRWHMWNTICKNDLLALIQRVEKTRLFMNCVLCAKSSYM